MMREFTLTGTRRRMDEVERLFRSVLKMKGTYSNEILILDQIAERVVVPRKFFVPPVVERDYRVLGFDESKYMLEAIEILMKERVSA